MVFSPPAPGKVSNKAGSAGCSCELAVEPAPAVEEDVIEIEDQPEAQSAPPAKKDETDSALPVEEPIEEETVQPAESAPAAESPTEGKKKKDKAPKISSELKNQSVTEGSEVKLTCKVKGQPTPEITWQLNGSDIKDNGVYSVSFDGEKCVLKIKETKAEYAGTYTVKVRKSLLQLV